MARSAVLGSQRAYVVFCRERLTDDEFADALGELASMQ
jgi:hypothetical protein